VQGGCLRVFPQIPCTIWLKRGSSCELFLRMTRSAAQSASPEVNKSCIEATADVRNGPCYAYVHCTYVKCLHSCVEVDFRSRVIFIPKTLNPGLLCKTLKGFMRGMLMPVANSSSFSSVSTCILFQFFLWPVTSLYVYIYVDCVNSIYLEL
jgi:hypothetical protein